MTCALDQGQEKACEYEALSYVWGSPAGDRPLEVGENEETLLITENCELALQHLRLGKQRRALWVDSICIDQKSDDEKDYQLKLMGEIYRQASSVRVWVGPVGDDDTGVDSFAFENLQAICSLGVKKTLRPPIAGWGNARISQLKHFFKRSWWERMWVVQEVALGQHVVFQMGSKELEYKILHTAYCAVDAYYGEISGGFRFGFHDEELYELMQALEPVRTLDMTRRLLGVDSGRDVKQSKEHVMTWTTIANMLRSRQATNPIDRLYSLFGLLPPSALWSPSMEPSYSLSSEAAFIETTYNIMKSSKSFMIFSFTARRTSDETAVLPSWVPNWELAPQNQHEGNLRVSRERLYNASNNTLFYLERLTSNTICLKGFFIDFIQAMETSLMPTTVWLLQIFYSNWRKMWSRTRAEQNLPEQHMYMDGTSADTAFRRTVLWDCELGAQEETLNRLTQAEAVSMFEAYDYVANQSRKGNLGNKQEPSELPSPLDTQRTAYMVNCVKERAFFVTATSLIGITQPNVQLGDHIFIVAGNSHPIILRPSKKYADTWQVVGECYLHGFMDGLGVMSMELCATVEKTVCADPDIQALKGTEKNPRWDEITAKPDGLWKWLLIE